jgi:hypothetical protein
MTKHTNTLQEKLALSLDLANTRDTKRTPAPMAPITAERKCSKISISLFETDLERLGSIRAYMASRGEMISTSQAVKLALRTAPLAEDLLTALNAIRAEDGRKG